MQVKITLDDKEFKQRLGKIADGVKSYKKPLNKIGDDLTKYYRKEVFDAQGRETGGWKPHSPSTLLARQMRTGHYKNRPIKLGQILVWTGKLKKGFRKTVTPFRLVVDNTVDYFKYNQATRKMLDVNKKVLDKVEKRISDYLNTLVKK